MVEKLWRLSRILVPSHGSAPRRIWGSLLVYLAVSLPVFGQPVFGQELKLPAATDLLNAGVKVQRIRKASERNGDAMSKSIPKGLTAAHVREAIKDLDGGIEHTFRKQKRYSVIHNGKSYAPKAVVGVAFRHLTGEILGPRAFRTE